MVKRFKLSLMSIIDDHGQTSKHSQDGFSKVKVKEDDDKITWASLE